MKRSHLLSSPLVWGLSVAACGPSNNQVVEAVPTAPTSLPSANTQVSASSVAPVGSANALPPKDSSVAVSEMLRVMGVGGTTFATPELYSWTSEKQLSELQAGAPFLSREVSATRGPAAFDDLLATDADRANPWAKVLFSQGFAKKRFAWTSAFATMGGEGDGTSYGNVLLRIKLKADALVVNYQTGQVMRLDGTVVSPEEAKAHPEKIAAVFFTGDGYREFVLVNESMIARWWAGSDPHVVEAIKLEIDFLNGTIDAMEQDHSLTPGMPSSTEILLQSALAQNQRLTGADLKKRAKNLSHLLETPLPALSKEPALQFTLGKLRPPFLPACKVVKRDARKVSDYIGSFATPKRNSFFPTCQPANAEVKCTPTEGARSSDANCIPLPAFMQ